MSVCSTGLCLPGHEGPAVLALLLQGSKKTAFQRAEIQRAQGRAGFGTDLL